MVVTQGISPNSEMGLGGNVNFIQSSHKVLIISYFRV